VIFDLLKSVSLLGVEGQDVLDEVADFIGQVLRELEVNGPDSLVSLIVVWCFERREATAKFVTENAKTPNVNSLIVRLLHHHLRR
jgi:hypothetical protein